MSEDRQVGEHPGWPRKLSIVFEGVQIWAYPRPGPRTWAFRMPGETRERHYTRQNGAKDAISAIRAGRIPQPDVDPVAYLDAYERGRPLATAVAPRPTGSGGVPRAAPARVVSVDFASSAPPGWIGDLAPDPRAAVVVLSAGGSTARVWSVGLWFRSFRHPALVGLQRRERWPNDYGKPLVMPAGRDGPADGSCAEIEVARALRRAGWDAWWTDGYGQAPARWKPWIRRPSEWNDPAREILDAVRQVRGGVRGGVPDVIAVRGSAVVFVECKGPDDTIHESQIQWLAAAAGLGMPGTAFVLARFSVTGQEAE